MKKQKNKQVIKASKLAKAENMKKKVITVQNAEGEPETQAEILIQNKIGYTPKVSVIIPVYNVEEYLRECLDSVVKQTLREIEIICVDDGSTDNSLEILKEYAKKDNRITVITQKNLHAGVARNAGLAVAKGEYLSFLDSDDFFELNMLEETYNKAKIDNADIVIFRYIKYDCKNLTEAMNVGANTKILSSNRIVSSEICSQYIFQITCPMPWNKIFKREFIEDIKIKYQSITLSNDLYFVYAAISSAIRISYLPNNLMKYRIFNKGALSGARAKYPFLFLDAFDALYRYLKKTGKLAMFYKSFCKILYDSIKWTANQQENTQEFMLKLFEYNTLKRWGVKNIDEIKELGEKEQIIISLTSYPARINTVHITIKSLLNQTKKADKVILWLAFEQFPNKEKDLPEQLLELRDKGLTIDWCHDIKSYKKLIPTLKKYPEAIIVTADDDIIYPQNWLELLYKGYQEEPLSISCHRAFRIRSTAKGILPYKQWNKGKIIPRKGAYGIYSIDTQTDFGNFYTSGSGAVYPPHLLYKDVFNEELFLKLAPTEDDIWYWAMAVQNDIPIHVVRGNLGLFEANIYANQEFALYNINSQNDTTNTVFKNIFNYYPHISQKVRKNKEIIISLTSYPARIGTVNQTIESLLNQTMKADKVILWLAPEQFPNKEKDLPQQLLDLRDKGLTIDWYHDIKSYKKLIPTLQKYPDAIIVTADDDNIYSGQWLETLYNSYIEYPRDIQCHRVTKFYHNQTGFHTIPGGYEYYKQPSYLNKLVGLGGVLYPPHCFYKDILNEELIMKLAPTNDDQWFWFQAILNNTRVRVIENPLIKANYIAETQKTGLTNINDKGEHLFWKDFKNLINYYPKVKEALIKENNTYKIIYKTKIPYKQELQSWYQNIMGEYLNIDNPRTFNEKIQWLKLYDSTPIKTRLADKYLVRDWVKEKIGEQYLIPLLGVYDKFEEIDFDKLPNQFVIKCNHGSGWNIIVKDKVKLDLLEVKEKLDKWMSTNFAFRWGYELHYKNMQPKIIIEKYMEDESGELRDYKYTCFNGKPEFIWIDSERYTNHKRNLYDLNWKQLPYKVNSKYQTFPSPQKPKCLDEMTHLAQILSKDFPYVRVDFYIINNHVYFGEMTFTSSSGTEDIYPRSFDIYLARKIKLPKMAYNIENGEYYELPQKSKLKPYSLLLYNIIQKEYLQRKKKVILNYNSQAELTNSRIDIKNFGNANNAVEITTLAKISAPAWFANTQGQGQVVESSKKIQNITIRAVQDGKLILSFKGQDKRYNGTRFQLWVDYKSIKIDGKEILSAPVETWHDKPFRYEMPVKDGQVVKVEVVQQYHQYSKDELKDVILKLNPNSDYINVNINKLTKKIYKKITVKMTTSNSTLQKTLFTKAKQNIQARIKLWRDKFSFAHKLTPVIDLMQKNQIQTLKMLQELQKKSISLENKNNELKNEVEVLKSTFNTQLSDLKKLQEESTKQLIATGDKFFAEFSRAMEEFQNYGIPEISEIKNYYADFAYQLGNTEVRLLNELSMQRETAQQNKNNIISGVNQTEQSLHIQVAKFQEMVQEQQAVLDSVQKSLEDLSGLKEIDFAQQEELKSLTKELETQKSHLVKEVQNLQNKVQRQYQELNFADLLHDSTKDSPWLKDRSFALYGWAANYSFIYTLFRILDNIRPAYILEMGLGQTSLVTSQYIANNNPEADLDIIENDTDWINVYRSKLAQHKNIRLHQCDIEFFDYAGEKNRKYKDLHKITQEKKYNLILVDGPIGGAQKFPRSNIVDLVQQNLAEDFIIIFDDAERSGEQNTIAKTKEKLSVMGIDFGVQQRNALKSQVLIFSKSCEFAKYL